VGGVAGGISEESSVVARFGGKLEIEDLKTVKGEDADGNAVDIVISRSTELKLVEPKTGIVLNTHYIPYGSSIFVKDGDVVEKGATICKWDPYNGVIISEFTGKVAYEDLEQGQSFLVEIDEQTGFQEKVISEGRNKKLVPTLLIYGKDGELIRSYNLPVGAHLMVREIAIESKFGEVKKYLVKLSNQILVQENDYVKAGTPLSDGAITPEDILRIQGPSAVQQYLVNEIQEVYRLQGVKINDKHFEVVIRQMMRKVRIVDPGDTLFLEDQLAHTSDFLVENDKLYGMKVVEEAGDSENLKPGQIISPRQLRDENSLLKRNDKNIVVARDVITATATPVLQGITRASLQTKSFISAASFQETTKVLNEAAVAGKVDTLEGLKENVIVGHRIPAGTGMRDYDNMIVGSKEEYNELVAAKEEFNY